MSQCPAGARRAGFHRDRDRKVPCVTSDRTPAELRPGNATPDSRVTQGPHQSPRSGDTNRGRADTFVSFPFCPIVPSLSSPRVTTFRNDTGAVPPPFCVSVFDAPGASHACGTLLHPPGPPGPRPFPGSHRCARPAGGRQGGRGEREGPPQGCRPAPPAPAGLSCPWTHTSSAPAPRPPRCEREMAAPPAGHERGSRTTTVCRDRVRHVAGFPWPPRYFEAPCGLKRFSALLAPRAAGLGSAGSLYAQPGELTPRQLFPQTPLSSSRHCESLASTLPAPQSTGALLGSGTQRRRDGPAWPPRLPPAQPLSSGDPPPAAFSHLPLLVPHSAVLPALQCRRHAGFRARGPRSARSCGADGRWDGPLKRSPWPGHTWWAGADPRPWARENRTPLDTPGPGGKSRLRAARGLGRPRRPQAGHSQPLSRAAPPLPHTRPSAWLPPGREWLCKRTLRNPPLTT